MVFTVNDYNQMHPQEIPLTARQFKLAQQRERALNYAIAHYGENQVPTYEYNMDQRPPHPVRNLLRDNLLRDNWTGPKCTMNYGSNLRAALSGNRSAKGKNTNRVFSMGRPFLDSQIQPYLGVQYRPPTPTPPTVRRKGTRSLSNGKKKKSSSRRTLKAKSR